MPHDCYPDLTETQRLIRDTARKVVERELKPHVQKLGGTTEIQELTIAKHLVNA
jgi:alkylation response protein AidB-like acyl-CoA dehydrogenase